MKRIIASLLIVLGLWSAAVMPQEAADPTGDPAVDRADSSGGSMELSLYVFREGRPVAGLLLLLDDRFQLRTNENGAINAQIRSGIHTLTLVEDGETLLDQSLLTIDGENLQMIVTLREQFPADVDIETSDPEKALAADTTETAAQPEGDPGILEGRVLAAETGTPIRGARVFVSGTGADLRTDDEGNFRANLPSRSYSVSIMHSRFATQTIDDVEIQPDATTGLIVELTPAGLELAEFVVVEPHLEGSLASVVDVERSAANIADVIGAEQISRAGDSDAAGALKRVTGVTVLGGKFVFIRGLGERYVTTLVNRAQIPSPDPTRRVVPLDLFPASILESIVVQKTYTPVFPGDFGGGVIEMLTRDMPEDLLLKLEAVLSIRQGTTFRDGLRYDGGDRDWTGYDDGTRDPPQSLQDALTGVPLVPQTPFNPGGFPQEEIQQFGRDLSNVWDVDTETIDPDLSTNFALGNRWDLGSVSLGFLGAARYKQSWDTTESIQRIFTVAGGEGDLRARRDDEETETVRNIEFSSFLNLGANLGPDHELRSTSMLLRLTEDETRISEGLDVDVGANVRRTRLQWVENELFVQQFRGTHLFPLLEGLEFRWFYEAGKAIRESPYTRSYRYDEQSDGRFCFSRRADSNEVIFEDLNDDLSDGQLAVDLNMAFGDNVFGKFTAGIQRTERNRDSAIRRFLFNDVGPLSQDPDVLCQPSVEDVLADENVGSQGFQLVETTRATDNYVASQEVDALFLNLDYTFFDLIRLTGGARQEQNRQEVVTFELFNPDAAPIVTALDTDDVLPAFSATWFINDSQQLRLAWSETLNRPDFRELSPAPFTEPATGREVVGNPDLQPAAITHFDIRWEKYFSPTELLSVALFYKDFTDPIERIILPGTIGLISFDNAETATASGIEFDFYKGLGFVRPWLEGWHVAGNLAFIDSEVSLGEANIINTTDNRPLQGQSPWVVNLQLGYTNEARGQTATLLFNMFGETIVEVGTVGLPDKKLQPVPILDFVYSQRFADQWKFKLRLKNLLDPKVESLVGNEVSDLFRRGREVSFGVEWSPY